MLCHRLHKSVLREETFVDTVYIFFTIAHCNLSLYRCDTLWQHVWNICFKYDSKDPYAVLVWRKMDRSVVSVSPKIMRGVSCEMSRKSKAGCFIHYTMVYSFKNVIITLRVGAVCATPILSLCLSLCAAISFPSLEIISHQAKEISSERMPCQH